MLPAKYIPFRKYNSRYLFGMNLGKDSRFVRVRQAFARDSVYYGEHADWYIVAAVNRDSDCLDRSNFAGLLSRLGGESDTIKIERASHWACGWVDYLIVQPTDRKALRTAIAAACEVYDYPILDEDHYSEVEDADCRALWEDCFDARDRVDWLRRHGYSKGTPLADLIKAVRGAWDYAAAILNCPGDLAHA